MTHVNLVYFDFSVLPAAQFLLSSLGFTLLSWAMIITVMFNLYYTLGLLFSDVTACQANLFKLNGKPFKRKYVQSLAIYNNCFFLLL